jgi:putative transposase
MTLPESAVSELVEVARLGEGADFIRSLVEVALQALIDTEAAAAIGAGRYERTDERVAERNGVRSRTLSTTAGGLSIFLCK